MAVLGGKGKAGRGVPADDAGGMPNLRVINSIAARMVCIGAALLLAVTLLGGRATATARRGQSVGKNASALSARGCYGNSYWRSERDGDQRCPRTHSMLADVSWWRLRWTTWNRDQARGHGITVHYDCAPRRCRWGKSGRVEIRLFRSRLCPDGSRIYTHISAVYSSSRYGTQRSDWSYYCGPRLTRRDGGGG